VSGSTDREPGSGVCVRQTSCAAAMFRRCCCQPCRRPAKVRWLAMWTRLRAGGAAADCARGCIDPPPADGALTDQVLAVCARSNRGSNSWSRRRHSRQEWLNRTGKSARWWTSAEWPSVFKSVDAFQVGLMSLQSSSCVGRVCPKIQNPDRHRGGCLVETGTPVPVRGAEETNPGAETPKLEPRRASLGGTSAAGGSQPR
jgi:hypothetical protein